LQSRALFAAAYKGDGRLNMTSTNSSQRRIAIKRLFSWLIKLLVSAGLVGYLLSKIGVENAIDKALSIPAENLFGALTLFLLQAILGGLRWRLVVIALGAQLTTGKAVVITFISLFFNQFLPASVGADIARIWQARKSGLTLPTAMTSVILERIANFLCVVAMTLLAIPVWTKHLYGEGARSAFIATGAFAALFLILIMHLDRLPETWRHWPAFRWLSKLAHDSRSLFLHPFYASMVFATAIAGQLSLATATLLLANGLGFNLRLLDCLITMPAVSLVSSLPISVAGWGVRELAMISAFGMLGVPAESALAVSLVMAMAGLALALPGALFWIARRQNETGEV